VSAGCDAAAACPQTPPPAKQSFAPKSIPKQELGNERAETAGAV
jgi:hypothetical protein